MSGKGWRHFLRRAKLTWQCTDSSVLVSDIARRAATTSFSLFLLLHLHQISLHTFSNVVLQHITLGGSSIKSRLYQHYLPYCIFEASLFYLRQQWTQGRTISALSRSRICDRQRLVSFLETSSIDLAAHRSNHLCWFVTQLGEQLLQQENLILLLISLHSLSLKLSKCICNAYSQIPRFSWRSAKLIGAQSW